MFKRLLLMTCALIPGVMHAQGVRYDSSVTTYSTNVPTGAQAAVMTVPNAIVTVCTFPASGTPCTNTVQIFQDQALTIAVDDPLTTDAVGRYGFWIAPGIYSQSYQTSSGKNVGTFPLSLDSPPGPQGPGGIGCGTGNCLVGAPTVTQPVAQPTGTTFAVNSLNSVLSADQFAGADIGVKVTAAFISCAAPKSSCKVTLPPGHNFSFSNSIYIPGDAALTVGSVTIPAADHSVMQLDCQGSTITWMGAGDAIHVLSENTADPTGSLSNCVIVNGTSNTNSLAAVHQFSRIWFTYNNNTFSGFSNAGGVGIELDNVAGAGGFGYNERTHFIGDSFSFNTKGVQFKGSNGGTGSFARTVMLGTECGLNANQICVSVEGSGTLQSGDAYGGTFDIHSNGTTGSRVVSLTSGGVMRLGLANIEGEGTGGFLIYVDNEQALFQMSGFANASGGLTNFTGATSNSIQPPVNTFGFVMQANPFAFGEEQSQNPKFTFDGANLRFGMPFDFITPNGTFQLYNRVTTNGSDPEVDATPSTGNIQKNLMFCSPLGCGFGNGYGRTATTGGTNLPAHELEFTSTFANQAATAGTDIDGTSYAVGTNYNVHSSGLIINNTGFGFSWTHALSTIPAGDTLTLNSINPSSSFVLQAITFDAAGDVRIPALKSPSSTKWYVCADNNGNISSQLATCN